MTDTLELAARVVVSLALVLALLWFLARRLGAGTAATRRVPVTVLGRQSLGRRAGVAVVDVAGRTLVLGVSDSGVRLLTEVETPPFEMPDGEGGGDGDGEGLLAPPREGRSASPFAGSVIAPATWRASWMALRRQARS